MSKQFKLNSIDDKFKIKIMSEEDGMVGIVEAPLPETFGLTVGSEFSAPFDAQSLAGVLQKFKIPAGGMLSRRVGVVTTKFYSNPEPTEISFDIEFKAEYSARHEVVEPALALMLMSLGESLTSEDFRSTLDNIRDGLSDLTNGFISGSSDGDSESGGSAGGSSDDIWGDADNAMSLIGLIKGPSVVRIRFGHIYELAPVWISSVSPQFSNILDAEGMPLSCVVSVTAVIQRDPVKEDMLGFFHAGGR